MGINKKFKDLSMTDFKNMGVAEEKALSLASDSFTPTNSEWESDTDLMVLNNTLRDDLGNSRANREMNRLDCKNLPKNIDFSNLNGKEILEIINKYKLLMKEYPLSDEDIEIFLNTKSVDDDLS